MSARDVMLNAGLPHYSEGGCMGLDEFERRDVVESIIEAAIAALTSSGYRILGPGDVDPVTVEKCAAVAENCPDTPFAESRRWHGNLRQSIPAAIRALCATHQGDK